MRVVDHERGPRVDSFHASRQLAPEDVLGRVGEARHVALGHVVEERVIGEAALELRLPEVVVRVDAAGRDYFGDAVDDAGVRWRGDGWGDFSDEVTGNEEVGVTEGGNVVGGSVEEDRAVLEEDGWGGHGVTFVFTVHRTGSVRAQQIYSVLQAKSPLLSDQRSICRGLVGER